MLSPLSVEQTRLSIPRTILGHRDLGRAEKLVYGFLIVRQSATSKQASAAIGEPIDARPVPLDKTDLNDLFRSLNKLRTAGVLVPNA